MDGASGPQGPKGDTGATGSQGPAGVATANPPLSLTGTTLSLNIDGTLRVNAGNLGIANSVVLPGAPSAGSLSLTDTTPSNSPTTGALRVAGGLGVGGAIWAGGSINGSAAHLGAGTSGVPSTKLEVAVSSAADVCLNVYQVGYSNILLGCKAGLTSGFLTNAYSGGVIGDPAYSIELTNTGVTKLTNTTASSSPTTGALTVAGGVGIGGNIYIGGNAYKPAGGPWVDSSDARIKTVVGDYEHGLAEVLQLTPRRYVFKGNDTNEPTTASVYPYENSSHFGVATAGVEYIGLIAQEVEAAMPEMVSFATGYIDGKTKITDLRALDTGALIYALVNAVKELTARVQTLEGG